MRRFTNLRGYLTSAPHLHVVVDPMVTLVSIAGLNRNRMIDDGYTRYDNVIATPKAVSDGLDSYQISMALYGRPMALLVSWVCVPSVASLNQS